MVDIIVFELPYVLAECCDMPSRTIVEAVFMGGISLLEGSLSQKTQGPNHKLMRLPATHIMSHRKQMP